LFLEFLHCRLQRLGGRDDVVVLPEILVPVFVHHVVEHAAALERILGTDTLLGAVGTVHHHHLRGRGKRGGEKAFLPVALEADKVAHIVQVSLALTEAVGHQIGHLMQTETQPYRLLEQASTGRLL